MRIADETLFQDFERLRPQHTSDAACHRAMLLRYEAEHGVTLSRHTLRRRLNLYRKLVKDAAPPPPVEALPNVIKRPELFQRDLGQPWTLPPGDYVIVGDVQLRTTNYEFMQRPLDIAREYLKRGQRHLIIGGDFFNADAFSGYESDQDEDAFDEELQAGRHFFDEYMRVFDKVYWFLGNHERRVGKRTRNAIKPAHLLRLVTWDKRVEINHWGHCVIKNPRGYDWRITHARNYSVNQLVVADQLALKYQQNIVQHHEHHCAIGWDRYKRYVVVNNGGLFDQSQMTYAVLDDSKAANMQNAFTLLRNDHANLLSVEPFTDWSMWLKEATSQQRPRFAA